MDTSLYVVTKYKIDVSSHVTSLSQTSSDYKSVAGHEQSPNTLSLEVLLLIAIKESL